MLAAIVLIGPFQNGSQRERSSELPTVTQRLGGRAVLGLFLSQEVMGWLFLSGDESH